jgi:hypothetical protein
LLPYPVLVLLRVMGASLHASTVNNQDRMSPSFQVAGPGKGVHAQDLSKWARYGYASFSCKKFSKKLHLEAYA